MSLESKKNTNEVKKGKNNSGKKIKILFVFNSCKNRGPTRVILNIIKNLDCSRFKPVLLTFSEEIEDSSIEEFLPYVSRHFLCKVSKADIILGRFGKLRSEVERIDPDVIHTTGVFPDYAISKLFSKHQVITIHNYANEDYISKFGQVLGTILVKMQYYAARHVAKAVACSQSLVKLYKRHGLDLCFIRNGVDTKKFNYDGSRIAIRKKLNIPLDTFVFIYTGHLSKGKNISFALDVFSRIFGNSKKACFILLGDGSEEKRLRQQYSGFNNIIFIGRVNNVNEYLIASDIYVSASKTEGLPNGVLEAIASGLPVLLSDIPQHMEILESGDGCGYSFSLDDNKKLDSLMKKVVSDGGLKTLAKNARKTAERHFSSYGMSKQYQEIYKNIAGRRRITLFIGSLSGGGAERVTCNLANYLNENGYKVDVITMSNAHDTYILNGGVNRFNLLDEKERAGKIYNLKIRKKRLKEYVIKNQDVSCYVVMLPITIFMLIRLKKLTGSKMIISERNNPSSYKLYEKIIMKYAAKKCDGLVVQTEEIGKWYKNIKNKVVIPNAINRDIIFPERSAVEKKIVSVSRLEKQKNIPMLIEGFARFHKKYSDYILEIYGKGSLEGELEELVKKHDLNDKIKFMGYVDNVAERIANATCFVLTSNHEGMPNALIEAMCIGVPCIATDCDGGGSREIIEDGKNGILIEKNDVDGLLESLEYVIGNGRVSDQLGKDAKKLKIKLSYECIYKKWLDYIDNLARDELR